MLALTIHQPWASAIVLGPKRLENRRWKPPAFLLGKRLAVHAGKVLDLAASEELRDDTFGPPLWPHDPTALVLGAVIGTVRVPDYVTRSADPWFCGPIGWVLEDPRPCEPMPCRGAQGLWLVPDEILRRIGGEL